MVRNLCIVSRQHGWIDALDRCTRSSWNITRYDPVIASHEIPADAFACIVAKPSDSLQGAAALRLALDLWDQQAAVPVLILLDPLQPAPHDWTRPCGSSVLPAETPVERVSDHIEQLVLCWQPVRESARRAWHFLNRAAQLSPRERYVMDRLVEGSWIKRIAHELGTSPHTVRNQRARIFEKLQVESEKEMLRLAFDARWITALQSMVRLERDAADC